MSFVLQLTVPGQNLIWKDLKVSFILDAQIKNLDA